MLPCTSKRRRSYVTSSVASSSTCGPAAKKSEMSENWNLHFNYDSSPSLLNTIFFSMRRQQISPLSAMQVKLLLTLQTCLTLTPLLQTTDLFMNIQRASFQTLCLRSPPFPPSPSMSACPAPSTQHHASLSQPQGLPSCDFLTYALP